MRRGEIWTAATRGAYTSKPRPVAVVQDDRFDATNSITVCALTTDIKDMPLIRLEVMPNEINGLRKPSALMVDRVATVPRQSLRDRIGRLSDEDMTRLGRALVVFLGIA